MVSRYKTQDAKRRDAIGLVFKISQNSRDEQLMESLVSYLGAGYVYKYNEVLDFKI